MQNQKCKDTAFHTMVKRKVLFQSQSGVTSLIRTHWHTETKIIRQSYRSWKPYSALHTSSYYPISQCWNFYIATKTSRFTHFKHISWKEYSRKHVLAAIHEDSVSVTYTKAQVHTTCTKSNSNCSQARRSTIIHMAISWLLASGASLLTTENTFDLHLPVKRRLENTHLTSSCTVCSHITDLHAEINDQIKQSIKINM